MILVNKILGSAPRCFSWARSIFEPFRVRLEDVACLSIENSSKDNDLASMGEFRVDACGVVCSMGALIEVGRMINHPGTPLSPSSHKRRVYVCVLFCMLCGSFAEQKQILGPYGRTAPPPD